MSSHTPLSRLVLRRLTGSVAALALSVGALSGCSVIDAAVPGDSGTVSVGTATGSIWDSSTVHEIALDLDEDELASMIATYQETGEKEWISADITIDGQTISDVGVRLKGNSSLRGVSAESDPAELPWLVDLDKFVDGQSLDGWERFVIRSNTSETSLNEAVALDLLTEAGLASQEAVASSFSVNGADAALRLLVQDLDSRWDEATFGTEGTLYKAEAGGDWSYRGVDEAAYTDVFDIEAGTEDYEPLTDFLRWLEESSDEEFADGLSDRLDVDAFATYLAFEDLIGNFDDIDGPGNNAFLRWDAEAQQLTVLAWDHNLAFGVVNEMGRGGGAGPAGGGGRPEGAMPPEGTTPPEGGPTADGDAGGGPGGSNVLADRFRSVPEFAALYDDAVQRLDADLFDGTAQEILDQWSAVLTQQGQDWVDGSSVEAEAEQVASYFDGHGAADDATAGGST